MGLVSVLTLCALGTGLAISACSSEDADAPADSVVIRVGNTEVDREDVSHWAKAKIYPNGLSDPKQRALHFLISEQWLLREAERRGLRITADGLSPATTGLTKAAKRLGLRAADIRRFTVVTHIASKLKADTIDVTPAEIAGYYREHRDRFVEPPMRRLKAALTRTMGAAMQIRSALGRGESWQAARTAVDSGERVALKTLTVDTKDGEEALVRAAYATKPGQVGGPIATNEGYLVIRGVDAIPGRMIPRPIAYAKVEALLQAQKLQALRAKIFDRYSPDTTCDADFRTRQCQGAGL